MIEAGLILEGGAERGVFTAGVLDCLMEEGIEFSYSCGVSAGACNAVDYLSKQIGRSKQVMIPVDPSMRMAKLSAIPTQHSIIDMEMLFDRFPNRQIPFDYDTYFASPMSCELVVTNALTGEAEYLDERADRKRLMQILRASSSIPVFTPMVMLDGVPYVDGSIADPIPIMHSMKKGFRKNVIVLTQERSYRKSEPDRKTEAFYRAYFRKYPKLRELMIHRPRNYNRMLDVIEKWEREGLVFVLRPETGVVGRLESDPAKLTPFFQHGYDVMRERLGEMKEYLTGFSEL